MDESFAFSAANIAKHVRCGELSIVEVLDHYAARLEKLNPVLNTHSYWNREQVWESAQFVQKNLEKWLKMGKPLRLAGVPIGIKDNIATKAIPTTCGSALLRDYCPEFSAEAVKKLTEEGAILFGKTNMDEFGMGSTNENSLFGPVLNPWNLARVAGGSSGGSAAAVAAGLVPVALGSDTGGSVRQPASFCGVVGLKPSYGRVSRRGLIAYGSSLDQIGPIAENVKDVSLVLDVIAGYDLLDSTSRQIKFEPIEQSIEGLSHLRGIRIGVIDEFFPEEMNEDVRNIIEASLEILKGLGAQIVRLKIPETEYLIPCYYLIAMAEASANLARYDGIRYGKQEKADTLEKLYLRTRTIGFGKEVKKRMMLGAFALSAGYCDDYYNKAIKVRKLISQKMAHAFQSVDVIVSPTVPNSAFPLGRGKKDPLEMYLADIYTVLANLTGLPAVSLPCGYDSHDMPIGLQFLAKPFDEKSLLQVAHIYEQSTKAMRRRPTIGR